MEGNLDSRCLICCGDLATTQPHSKSHEDKLAKKSIITKHLHIIFILKHIFELPSHQLSLHLWNCPNVEQWITICETCDELIDSCRLVYQDLLKVNRKFRATKQRIVNIVQEGCGETGRRGSKCDHCLSKEEEDYDAMDIMDRCRRFISKRKYTSLFDPFVEGDSKAREYVNQTKIKTEVVEESDPAYDDDYDEHVGWECNNDADINITENVNRPSETDNKTIRKSSRPKPRGVGKTKKLDDEDWTLTLEREKKKRTDYANSIAGVECPTCGKMVNKYKLARHNQKVHGSHQCDLCPNNFSSKKNLLNHRTRMHSKPCNFSRLKGSVTCPEPNCNSIVVSVKDLELHFQTAHKDAHLLNCLECGKGFFTSAGIKAHMNEHSRAKREKSVICEHCGSAFWSGFELRAHQKKTLRCKLLYQTEAEATVVCDQCGKKLAGEDSLKSHIKMTHNEELEQKKETFRCDHCGTEFKKKSNWHLHLFEEHHMRSGKNKKGFYKCPEAGCDRVYRENKTLQYHLTQHSGQPQCRCEECGKMFYFPKNLKGHKLKVHNQDGKFKCEVCGNKSTSWIYLKRHMETHNTHNTEDSTHDKMGEQQ